MPTGGTKDVIMIGGPNGAGKTTMAFRLLPRTLGVYGLVNADEIARGVEKTVARFLCLNRPCGSKSSRRRSDQSHQQADDGGDCALCEGNSEGAFAVSIHWEAAPDITLATEPRLNQHQAESSRARKEKIDPP